MIHAVYKGSHFADANDLGDTTSEGTPTATPNYTWVCRNRFCYISETVQDCETVATENSVWEILSGFKLRHLGNLVKWQVSYKHIENKTF